VSKSTEGLSGYKKTLQKLEGLVKTPYKRPSGSTTKAQRESVQGKP
jgi:hypothetical protein